MPYSLVKDSATNGNDISGSYLTGEKKTYTAKEIKQIERIRAVRENLSNEIMQRMMHIEDLKVA